MNRRAGLNDWVTVVRDARLGASATLVALVMASYADPDGSKIFPGISRIAVDAELAYSTVRAAIRKLRRAGLIELAHAAPPRSGRSNEYRLVFADDLPSRCEVLNAAAKALAIERTAAANRGSAQWRAQRFADRRAPVNTAGKDDFCRSPDTGKNGFADRQRSPTLHRPSIPLDRAPPGRGLG